MMIRPQACRLSPSTSKSNPVMEAHKPLGLLQNLFEQWGQVVLRKEGGRDLDEICGSVPFTGVELPACMSLLHTSRWSEPSYPC